MVTRIIRRPRERLAHTGHMDACSRSIVKTISYRVYSTTITATVAWVVTGKIETAVAIGMADIVVKVVTYYIFERAWERVSFGRCKAPEYEI